MLRKLIKYKDITGLTPESQVLQQTKKNDDLCYDNMKCFILANLVKLSILICIISRL